MDVKFLPTLAALPATQWNTLVEGLSPFMRYEFLHALEHSGCVSEHTGWLPCHCVVYEQQELIAVMPMYLKFHSRGEYVFDHQWAQAYQRHGVRYYPKCLTAIPFTPCAGARWGIKNTVNTPEVLQQMFVAIQDLCANHACSSWHCLFPEPEHLASLTSLPILVREAVQFQWFNKGYADFTDFLQSLTSAKRKMIKRERAKVNEQGVQLIQLKGTEVSAEQWQIFYQFYAMTYLKKGSQPYLNVDFFLHLADQMGSTLLVVFARTAHEYVGAALSFIGEDTLYGRYWGCIEEYAMLHFEACYYQGIDFCIKTGLARFDSGAQGEHKIARGFEPITTYSAHWLHHEQFHHAIKAFISAEKNHVDAYKAQAALSLPFKDNHT